MLQMDEFVQCNALHTQHCHKSEMFVKEENQAKHVT